MKSGQRVVGVQADQRREGWHRRGIASLELGERVAILRVGGRVEVGVLQWFERAKRLATAAQQDIADRSPLKTASAVGSRGADANAGAEMLVGGLKPRSRVDGVTVSGVVEETAAAKIADQRRPGVNADPRSAETDALLLPPFAERLGTDVEVMGAGNGASGIVRLVAGRVE